MVSSNKINLLTQAPLSPVSMMQLHIKLLSLLDKFWKKLPRDQSPIFSVLNNLSKISETQSPSQSKPALMETLNSKLWVLNMALMITPIPALLRRRLSLTLLFTILQFTNGSEPSMTNGKQENITKPVSMVPHMDTLFYN